MLGHRFFADNCGLIAGNPLFTFLSRFQHPASRFAA
jgi:hypothetical protein